MPGNHNSSDSDSADEWAEPPQQQPNCNRIDGYTDNTSAADAAAGARSMQEMDVVERDLAGADVPVTFELPDGSTHAAKFYMGQSVEHMKVLLEKEQDFPYDKTTLYIGDRLLFDPLSLSDLPFKAGVENYVKVVRAD